MRPAMRPATSGRVWSWMRVDLQEGWVWMGVDLGVDRTPPSFLQFVSLQCLFFSPKPSSLETHTPAATNDPSGM